VTAFLARCRAAATAALQSSGEAARRWLAAGAVVACGVAFTTLQSSAEERECAHDAILGKPHWGLGACAAMPGAKQ
jgi:hypothetical protein